MISSRATRLLGKIQRVEPLDWGDTVWLIRRLGGEIEERRGSRVAFLLRGQTGVFHRPHPGPEMGRGRVRQLKDYLAHAGIL